MPDRPAIGVTIGLPPDDTVRAFDARGELRTTVRWSEMWQEEHARAFTVAKLARADILGEIQASLADMLANGGTFEQWKDGLEPYLRSKGWWGDVADRDLTGTDDVVRIGPRRLRTIYDTNLRVSRAAGRWKRIQELKASRPFLRYTAVLDSRTRPEHRRWHGVILPVDHEWWDTHFPPCGWNCRCIVRQLSQRELDGKGWTVSDVPDDGPPRAFYRAGHADPVMVPPGISPGFAYNPGRASLRGVLEKAARSAEALASVDIDAARRVLNDLIFSEVLPYALAQKGTLPVAVLAPEQASALGKSQILVLPAGVQRKQDRRHAEILVSDYRKLPDAIHDPLVIVEAVPGKKLIFFWRRGRMLWRAVVRSDEGQPYPAAVSFHIVKDKDLQREIRNGRLILDKR